MYNFAGVGVYISRIEEGSLAERAGLRPGDTILEVNGTPFTSISHDEALKVCVFVKAQFSRVGATGACGLQYVAKTATGCVAAGTIISCM